MKPIRLVPAIVPVLLATLAAVVLPGAALAQAPQSPAPAQIPAAAAPPPSQAAPALPAGITPQQAEAAKQAVESGAPLPPEAQRMLEAHPELKDQLPPELRGKLEQARKKEEEGQQAASPPPSERPPLPGYDWRASVYVGGLFSKRLRESEVGRLPHFGHEVFAPRPGAAATLENMPVTPDYIVGPGDEVIVRLWGRMEGTHRMTVDRDGKIYFPKIGSLYVAGKTFSELQRFLRAKAGTIAEVSSDVTLGQLKGIRVSVIGEVRSPGWYNVSSLHTAVQVLYLAGGIKDIGSLRRIEIRRGGAVAGTIDLYDFLLKGETGADIRLLQGDTIFVPVVGRLVALSGEVRRPAIYELREEKTLLDLVRMGGGFSPTAYKKRVQVERLEGNFARIVLDVDAEELEKDGAAFDLSDGDIVRVLPIVLADINTVTLEGNVVRPGKYELKPGMTVGSLLPDELSFLPETWFDYALLTRLVPPEMRKETIPVNLRAIVLEKKREADVALKPFDRLTVFPRAAFRDAPKVTVSGEVRRPGTFDLKEGARVADLVKLAGDLTKSAYLDQAEIVRVDENRDFHTIYLDLGKALAGDEKENLLLADEDQLRIHSIWEGKYRKTVTAAGELQNPGEYTLTEGMKLSDLIFKAGGFKESAYAREAELVRREIAPGGELVKTETVVVSPERAVSGDKSFDIPLREHDLLMVRRIPEWAEKIQVTLEGEVRFPGTYAALKGERLSSLIARAGGFTPDAYLKAAHFSRISTQRSQQEAIDKLIEQLEVEIAQKAQDVSGALDKEDIEANREVVRARQSLVAQLKKARAQGRVVIRLAEEEKLKGTGADILLEDGDRLFVPKKMNVVNVVGRVYNPTGVVFDPAHDTLGHYLRTVGGPTESADRDHIFLLKANGSVVTRENVEGGFFLFGDRGILSAKVEPGDSIVVPEKLVQTRLMKDVKDITQILYQIAVTAGVLIVAF
ncbi:MAG: SLBB domain-containing protein [Deltaproteobacteria bacterium]